MLGQKLTRQQWAAEQYSRALVAANDKLKEDYDRHLSGSPVGLFCEAENEVSESFETSGRLMRSKARPRRLRMRKSERRRRPVCGELAPVKRTVK